MLAAFVGLVATGPAQAQTHELGRFGLWRAYGGQTDSGTRLCGISTAGRDRSVHIKYFEGNPGFDLQVFDQSWNIPNEVPVQLAIHLGTGYRSAALNGRGYPRRDRLPARVELGFSVEGSRDFWSAFRVANEGRLVFLTGNEGSWRLNLTGSDAAASTMQACINRLGNARRPFDGSAPPPPAARQPFDDGTRQPFDSGRGPAK